MIGDPTLYVMNKMQEVFKELNVTVERYDLYEVKNNITALPQTLKDADGVAVVNEEEEIRVQVFGDAELVGIDNGDLGDVTPFSSDRRKTHRGRLVAYVRTCGQNDACIQVLGVGKKVVLNT